METAYKLVLSKTPDMQAIAALKIPTEKGIHPSSILPRLFCKKKVAGIIPLTDET